MVTFIITKEEKEVYRYITELNNFGEAFRHFLVQAVVVLVMMVLSKNSKHQYFLKFQTEEVS